MPQVDPNTNVSLYESDAIIEYLAKTYGDGSIPLMLRLGTITVTYLPLLSATALNRHQLTTPVTLSSYAGCDGGTGPDAAGGEGESFIPP